MGKEISNKLHQFLVSLGISPIYGATLIMLIISLITIRDLRKWDKLSMLQKYFDIIGWCSTIILLIFSLIYTIKVFFFKSM
jgi:hypothetical protein